MSPRRHDLIAKYHADEIARDTLLPLDLNAGSNRKRRCEGKYGISANAIAAFHAYPELCRNFCEAIPAVARYTDEVGS
ncbi:hypothetical protein USDA257_c19650 [Sinorhizobium fredii USDA 257]|uniref:Uncharacterized protein n=1 Tax=Sinorhizobium fredii (strain USDA 257) TaxID=1185652 RepID=I3X3U4_SINF2|nr:hypothetical protein USDA257_c19650 [Sinorhizobium fredii USDA 257]